MVFRRREPLHARLAREGGLGASSPPPHDTTPRWGAVGIHGVARPREWDAVATADAPALAGDSVAFVALPDGTLVVDEEVEDGALAPLAEALERSLRPPYRAEAVRRGERWAVAGRSIGVAELPPSVQGEALELTVHEGRRELRIDGEPTFGSIPALQWLAGDRESYVVRAERVDGNLWEVRVSPL